MRQAADKAMSKLQEDTKTATQRLDRLRKLSEKSIGPLTVGTIGILLIRCPLGAEMAETSLMESWHKESGTNVRREKGMVPMAADVQPQAVAAQPVAHIAYAVQPGELRLAITHGILLGRGLTIDAVSLPADLEKRLEEAGKTAIDPLLVHHVLGSEQDKAAIKRLQDEIKARSIGLLLLIYY